MIQGKPLDWETKNEISKVLVRWTFIIFVFSYFAYQFYIKETFGGQISEGGLSDFSGLSDLPRFIAVVFIALLATAVNLLLHLYFAVIVPRSPDRGIAPFWKYLTMGFDFIIVSMLLVPTGGDNSMFFLLYLVIILSNGMRYGMRLVLSGLLMFNLFYFCVLLVQYYPGFHVSDLSSETVKIAGVWGIGLYVGYLSNRFEQLHRELEQYKKLLEKLGASR